METPRGESKEVFSIADMTAIALCAGRGSRLEPLTQGLIPKPLFRVNDKALIDYSIELLQNAGVRKFVFAAGYKAEMIHDHVDQQSYAPLSRVVTVPSTGIVHSLRGALNDCDVTGHTVIFDTDAIRGNLDFADAYRFHAGNDNSVTLVGTMLDQPQNSNFVLINDPNLDSGYSLNPADHEITTPAVISRNDLFTEDHASYTHSEDIPNTWLGLVEYVSTLNKQRHT
jgi:NDP-sugar pyrophosphorylase family protein